MRLRNNILCLAIVAAVPQLCSGTVHTSIQAKGSLPPVEQWYTCVRTLREGPYDENAANACLRSILAHPAVTSGRIVVETKHKTKNIIFVIESPVLRLTTVDFGLPPNQDAEFKNIISQDEYALQKGDVYDSLKDTQTKIKLEEYLKSTGVAGLISEAKALDYEKGTATVSYKVWDGPHLGQEESLFRTRRRCNAYIGNFNETDIDDFTPLGLLNETLRIRRTPCFETEAIESAEEKLRATGLFSSVVVRTERSGKWQSVSVHVRARPTMIEEIDLKWCGLPSDSLTTRLPHIPLIEKEVYRRSLALTSRDILEEFLKTKDSKVKVFETDAVSNTGALLVTLYIVRAPSDELYINGVSLPEFVSP